MSSPMKTGPPETGEASKNESSKHGSNLNRGISILDLILRVIATIGTLGSSVAMGTSNQTLPFSFQSFQFRAEYNDLPMFTFFVIANSIVCGYLVLSLPLSIFHIIRSSAKISRIIFVIFDTVMLCLLACGASVAASIVYLAHKGNANANWLPICQQFSNFCQRISGSLIGSFFSVIILILIITSSAVSLSQI
ncbi:casparian strip membrane protein 3 [Manihot esculenta]|uniref:CASP-like protein n=1 Tax=Manihot esculenta TaxID=3983 RepID=A0A2C9VUY9_MANES|nr:casparian strip membrane protein 3 [Manihot esculenta]OAY50052.1 hypothetical protein MANES_05G104300v8 [Manihot esculenta]